MTIRAVCVWCVYACILGIDAWDPLGCNSLCYEWVGSGVQGSSRRITLTFHFARQVSDVGPTFKKAIRTLVTDCRNISIFKNCYFLFCFCFNCMYQFLKPSDLLLTANFISIHTLITPVHYIPVHSTVLKSLFSLRLMLLRCKACSFHTLF